MHLRTKLRSPYPRMSQVAAAALKKLNLPNIWVPFVTSKINFDNASERGDLEIEMNNIQQTSSFR
jgi:hypothetical protein